MLIDSTGEVSLPLIHATEAGVSVIFKEDTKSFVGIASQLERKEIFLEMTLTGEYFKLDIQFYNGTFRANLYYIDDVDASNNTAIRVFILPTDSWKNFMDTILYENQSVCSEMKSELKTLKRSYRKIARL